MEQAVTGASGLLLLRQELLALPEAGEWIAAAEQEVRATPNWARSLLSRLKTHDPVQTVLAVEEDCLGVYQYDAGDLFDDEYSANRAVIYLYWGVIGLVSEWMGCHVEDLTIVVLAHELAHAYTQLGADIEGRRWPARAFSAAEAGLKEGLAQYYTERVLRRLEGRFAGPLKAYQAMLPRQPEAYRTHEPWVKDSSPEAVRRAMLEVRRWREGELVAFNQRLADAQAGLQPA